MQEDPHTTDVPVESLHVHSDADEQTVESLPVHSNADEQAVESEPTGNVAKVC
jgi:hypothetical protein